jgi:ESS family glutamate:Na+ symporter
MFDFMDVNAWSLILTTAILLGAMMIANLMRRYIPFLRKMMFPSALLGGFIVLIVDFIYERITGHSMFAEYTLEYLTYHGLGLGFVALALKWGEDKKNTRERSREIFDSGISTVGIYLLQGILGVAVMFALMPFVDNIFPASGLLLAMGYGQGPGQAFNWGTVYESMGFENGASFGLTIAAMGLISASIGGSIYYASMRKRGRFAVGGQNEDADDTKGELVTAADEIPMSESMDKLTVQVALIAIAYALTFGVMFGLYKIFYIINPSPESFLMKTVNPLVWGFNFLIGTVVALLIKSFMKKLYSKGIMKRKYTNDFMLSRLGAFFFDLMVVASIAAIKLEAFQKKEFILPLSIICVLGAIFTYIYIDLIAKKVFPQYRDEQFLMLWGNGAGTASTGVILVREVDPEFKTPAIMNSVYMPVWAIVFGFPMLLFMGLAPDPLGNNPHGMAWVTLGALIIYFVFINLLLFRKSIFNKEKKDKSKNKE